MKDYGNFVYQGFGKNGKVYGKLNGGDLLHGDYKLYKKGSNTFYIKATDDDDALESALDLLKRPPYPVVGCASSREREDPAHKRRERTARKRREQEFRIDADPEFFSKMRCHFEMIEKVHEMFFPDRTFL